MLRQLLAHRSKADAAMMQSGPPLVAVADMSRGILAAGFTSAVIYTEAALFPLFTEAASLDGVAVVRLLTAVVAAAEGTVAVVQGTS